MKKFFFLGLMILSGSVLLAQATDSVIVVNKDARLDVLSKKHSEMPKPKQPSGETNDNVPRPVNGYMKGWRIQVLNTNNRELANKTKSDLLMRFPGYKSYMMYQTPFFKVRIGNFKDKGAAEALKKQLRAMFPTGVYIIPDIIEYRVTKEDIEEAEKEKKNK